MKKILLKPIILLLSITLLNSACEKWVDPNLNVDPNNPSDVSEALLLPNAQVTFAYTLGGDYSRYNSLFTQHHAGVDRQLLGVDNYSFKESDVNNAWNGMYTSCMFELKQIIDKAGVSKSPNYAGVAKVMSAMALMYTTDLFGDMPYSKAFKGASQLQTPYDTQEEVYTTIIRFCTEAIADLNETNSTFKPAANDLVFAGNLSKWIKTANAIRARAYLHIGKSNPANYTNALNALNDGALAGNDDDAVMIFGTSQANANPLYQFMSQRGDMRMSKFFIDLMQNNNDPRLPFFAAKTAGGTYVGANSGKAEGQASEPGDTYAAINAPVIFITYPEVKFIEAECKFRNSDLAGAALAHNQAVIASLTKITGSADVAYVAANASETMATISLEKIMTQKYIALYTNPETFTDVRRTNLPALTPVSGSQLPARWPYPQSERLYNSANFPGQKTIFEKLWWN